MKHKCICINGAGWGKIFEFDMVRGFYGSLISSHFNTKIKLFSCVDICLELETLWTYVRPPQGAAGHRSGSVNAECLWRKGLSFFSFLHRRRESIWSILRHWSLYLRENFYLDYSVCLWYPLTQKGNKGYFHTMFWITIRITLKQLKRSSFAFMDKKLHWIILIRKIAL